MKAINDSSAVLDMMLTSRYELVDGYHTSITLMW